MAIKYRQELGRPLTYAEGDENFRTLEDSIEKTLAEYPTLADAMADDIPDGVVFLVNDGDDSGYWRRDSSLPEGAEFLREFVEVPDVFTEVPAGKNLFDKSKVVVGERVNLDTGVIESEPGAKRSDYIKLEAGQTYTVSSGGTSRVGLFENIGDTQPIRLIFVSTFTVAQGENYAVLYVKNTEIADDTSDSLQLEEGDTATEYEPYVSRKLVRENAIDPDIARKTDIPEFVEIPDVFKEVPAGKNLFDKSKVVVDERVNMDTGVIESEPGAKRSDYIKLEAGQTYTVSGGTVRVSLFENIGDTQPIRLNVTSSFTVEEGENYGVLLVKNSENGTDNSDSLQLEEGDTATEYEPYISKKVVREENIDPDIIPEFELTVVSDQKFNKQSYQKRVAIGSDGNFEPSGGDAYSTYLIPIGEEDTSVSIRGAGEDYTKRISFFDENSTPISVSDYAFGEGVFPKPEGAKYVAVYFKTRYEDDPSILDTFVINFSPYHLPQDDYKEAIVKINDYPLLTSGEDSESLTEIPEYLDNRYIAGFNVKEIVAETEKYKNTIQSLRKIKQANSGELTFNIPNDSGVDQKDVVLMLNLHHGNQKGTPTDFDLFMNGLCNTDFSDIRFLDSDDNLLDMYKVSNGNYELIPDSDIQRFVVGNQLGMLFMSNGTGTISSSADNGDTWTDIGMNGCPLGFNQNQDLFVADGNLVYKVSASSNYEASELVLTGDSNSRFLHIAFQMDDIGHLYLGQTQTEFGAKIFKSTDGGDSWSNLVVWPESQHPHSIKLDRTVVPNTLYINVDGYDNEHRTTYKSTDRGNSFEKMDFGWFNPDYGVFFAGDGFRLGGGEGAVKDLPTIYRTEDDENFEIVLDQAQNTHLALGLKDAIYITGTSHKTNRFGKIYRSVDKGKTWMPVLTLPYVVETGMATGYRSGAYEPVHPAGDEEQLMMSFEVGQIPEFPGLRIYEGGNHYQGQFYVKVPHLPAGGLQLKVGYGYLAEDIEGDIFNEINPESVIHIPLNEYSQHVYDSNGNKHFVGNNWIGEGKRFGWHYPERKPANTAAVKFDGKNFITIKNGVDADLNFNNDFTVNFWLKLNSYDYDEKNKRFLFGRTDEGNELFFVRQNELRLGIQYAGNYEFVNTFFGGTASNNTRMFFMYTVTITSDNKMKVYINGGLQEEIELTGFDENMSFGDWKIGGFHGTGVDKLEDGYFTDFRIIKGALSDEEVIELFEGGKFIRP